MFSVLQFIHLCNNYYEIVLLFFLFDTVSFFYWFYKIPKSLSR